MRIVFYDFAFGSLGIPYLAAVLNQAGHEAFIYHDTSYSREYVTQALPFRCLFSIGADTVCREIMELRPDMVGFSMTSYSYAENLKLIKQLKREYPEAVVVCGGVHVTLLPHVVLGNPEIDFAVVGEGETALVRLADALFESSLDDVKALPPEMLPGVWNMRQGGIVDRGVAPMVADLDSLPFPDKSSYEQKSPAFNRVYSVAASRGCLYGCTYCNSPSMKALYRQCGKTFYRVRSVENIIGELRIACEKHRPRHIEFFDDHFGADLKWLREFCAAYRKEIGLPYGIQASPLLLDDERLRLLAESGCVGIELGFQSPNEGVRKTILNRHETNARVLDIARRARALGIFLELDFIVDIPGETPRHLWELLEFISQSRPHLANISYLQYLPQTELLAKALQEGVVSPERQRRIENGEGFGSIHMPENQRARYLILPIQAIFAQILPSALSRRLNRFVALPGMCAVFGLGAGTVVCLVRLWIALFDRRAYYFRSNTIRVMHAAKGIVWHKLRTMRKSG